MKAKILLGLRRLSIIPIASSGHHKLLHMENGYRLVEFVFEK